MYNTISKKSQNTISLTFIEHLKDVYEQRHSEQLAACCKYTTRVPQANANDRLFSV